MASKLALLQKLLIDREEVILLHRGKAHCSCGVGIDDFSDIENHLVHAHDKLSSHSSRKCLQVVLKDTINRLSDQEDQNLSEQQLDIEVPLKTFAVCLDEDLIGDGGRLREAFCHICSASCYSFKTLKDHYMRQHPQTWACPATCLNVDRILFTKPSKEQSLKIPTGWGYQYYCPLPGKGLPVLLPLAGLQISCGPAPVRRVERQWQKRSRPQVLSFLQFVEAALFQNACSSIADL